MSNKTKNSRKKSEATCSIVICTRHRPQHLSETLNSFICLLIPPNLSIEVVIVDNGPDEATERVVDAFRCSCPFEVSYVAAPERGLSRARNVGIRAARGDLILFTDDDVRVPPRWIELMTTPLLNDGTDLVAGRLTLPPSHERPWLEGIHRELLSISPSCEPTGRSHNTLIGGNFSFHRRILESVQGFDERLGPGCYFSGGEDELFAWQAIQAGYSILLQPESKCEHHFDLNRLSRDSLLRTAEGRGRGIGWILWHWRGASLRFPRLRALRLRCLLLLSRIKMLANRNANSFAPARELHLTKLVAMYSAYAAVRKEPRIFNNVAESDVQ